MYLHDFEGEEPLGFMFLGDRCCFFMRQSITALSVEMIVPMFLKTRVEKAIRLYVGYRTTNTEGE